MLVLRLVLVIALSYSQMSCSHQGKPRTAHITVFLSRNCANAVLSVASGRYELTPGEITSIDLPLGEHHFEIASNNVRRSGCAAVAAEGEQYWTIVGQLEVSGLSECAQ